jgi:hypothetical protein
MAAHPESADIAAFGLTILGSTASAMADANAVWAHLTAER